MRSFRNVMLITSDENLQCNKMVCPYCNTLSCYVCREIVTGYEHFNVRPWRSWKKAIRTDQFFSAALPVRSMLLVCR